ncbi:phosphotransferase [Actinophytocola sp.]|uniref:phosphotransferase n=1 Tax=Actinophytocola sp. TaxID=1872138 RepID=UPI00389A95E3
MTAPTKPNRFVKAYPTMQARAAAEHHYRWLTTHVQPVQLPALLTVRDTSLEFIHVLGRHALSSDLVRIAAHLGDAHGAAWTSTLHTARMDQPHPISRGATISDFIGPRLAALHRRHQAGYLSAHDLDAMQDIVTAAAPEPVAFYKDTNPRNILITAAGELITVDFDDLTLALFGYDLAKLIVTLAMTDGQLPDELIESALDAYNTTAARHGAVLGHVDAQRLSRYATLHHILTTPYLGRGGYRYPWPTVKPPARRGASS